MDNKENKKEIKDENINDEIFGKSRESLDLTTDNSRFFTNGTNLVSMELLDGGETVESFERVSLFRSFPITNPDEFISVREPDEGGSRRGPEIGMIRRLSDFDEETQKIVRRELDRRYFAPEILSVSSVKEKFGYIYFDVLTDAGNTRFILQNPFQNINVLNDGRVYIRDVDGNNFRITDISKLDSKSYKKMEMYL